MFSSMDMDIIPLQAGIRGRLLLIKRGSFLGGHVKREKGHEG